MVALGTAEFKSDGVLSQSRTPYLGGGAVGSAYIVKHFLEKK